MSRLRALRDAGVAIWLDTLSRELLDSGAFAALIDGGVTGATSNPTIFARAIAGSDRYDDQFRAAVAAGVRDPQELFLALALDDVGRAADLLRPVHDASGGRDGFVSFECTPDLADDTAATVAQALDLWSRLARPNVMIKVPATAAGIPAIEELTARGVNVNVTLLFSVVRYEQAVDAHLAGLERRLRRRAARRGDRIGRLVLRLARRRQGRPAAARRLRPPRPRRRRQRAARLRPLPAPLRRPALGALREAGARPQRPLWASTGTKDPAYSDVLYVERLIAPDVVNTMPESVLRAFADHGRVGRPLGVDTGDAERILRRAAAAGVDLEASPRSSSARGSTPSATPTARCWSGSPARCALSRSPLGPRGAPRPGSHPPAPGRG